MLGSPGSTRPPDQLSIFQSAALAGEDDRDLAELWPPLPRPPLPPRLLECWTSGGKVVASEYEALLANPCITNKWGNTVCYSMVQSAYSFCLIMPLK